MNSALPSSTVVRADNQIGRNNGSYRRRRNLTCQARLPPRGDVFVGYDHRYGISPFLKDV